MSQKCWHQFAYRVPSAALLPALCWLIVADTAWAQKRFSTIEIRRIIDTPDSLAAADQATLDEFLKEAFLKRFVSPGTGDELPKLRKGYSTIMRGAAKTPAHDYMTGRVFDSMLKIMGGAFPPAVKYNALLVIGDLNEDDAAGSIKPLPSAFAILLKALGASPKQDYYRVAALIGLQRIAQENAIPKEQTAAVSGKLLALLNEKTPPAGRSASAQDYFRRSAAKILAMMGNPGPNNSVLSAMEAIAADPTARPLLRCDMARFISELKITPESKVDLQRVANNLGHQAVEVCKQEVDRATASSRPASRALIMYAITSCSGALQKLGMTAERGTPARDFILPLKTKLDALYTKVGDPEETRDEDVDQLVETQIDEIAGLLQAKQVAEAPKPPTVVPTGLKQDPATATTAKPK